jgi:SAM-dependent methyltransferase
MEIELRHCEGDNFVFVGCGCQSDYDQYYATVANDTVHQELSAGTAYSPISKVQSDHLLTALDGFFAEQRKVLDFGCGEASLLVELAAKYPSSVFFGFEPGPAAQIGASKGAMLGLDNLFIADLPKSTKCGPYDLVVVSHVIEHVLDLDLFSLLNSFVKEGGYLYVEVPNSLQYEACERLEFLYYLDRLHVNHFTPQSLARLAAGYGFGYVKHFEYAFPYRDGGEYPALGMLFKKDGNAVDIESPRIIETANRYLKREQERAKVIAGQLDEYEGVLVWGAGDNYYRSVENGGPLSNLRHMILLDRRPQQVTVGGRTYQTIDPQTGIQSYSWPVVITVSEGRKAMSRQIAEIDPGRLIVTV